MLTEPVEEFVSWASWLADLLAAAEKDFAGFELSPEGLNAALDRSVYVAGNARIN